MGLVILMKMNSRVIISCLYLAISTWSLVSCKETKELYQSAADKVKEIKSGGETEALVKEVMEVNETDSKAIIQSEKRLVMLEFYTDTRPPCKKIAPVLERLAGSNADRVRIIKANATKNQSWAVKEKIRGVPSFRLYSGGVLVDQFAGGCPEKMLQGKIDKYAEVISSSSESGKEGEAPKEPSIRPMPKDWLPPGVTSQ